MRLPVELIIYDFDGVMTDNRALTFDDGREAVFVSRSDGLAIRAIKNTGIKQIIISTETNQVVKARAKKVDLPVIQCVDDKLAVVKEYLKSNNIQPKAVAFIGNDINDKEAMLFVGWPIAPSDAHLEIKKIAKIILNTRGGHGVIREFLDELLAKDKLK